MTRTIVATLAVLLISPALQAADFAPGTKLQLLSNLHPDMAKRKLSTMNYQLPGMIPICSEVIVKDLTGKEFEFEYQGVTYSMEYDKYTKGAGISLEEAVKGYFGPACDKAKMNKLGAIDKDGIKTGSVQVGMTKQGVLFAIGRPPYTATPSLDASYWLYWSNRFKKMGIQFDAKGKVSAIK